MSGVAIATSIVNPLDLGREIGRADDVCARVGCLPASPSARRRPATPLPVRSGHRRPRVADPLADRPGGNAPRPSRRTSFPAGPRQLDRIGRRIRLLAVECHARRVILPCATAAPAPCEPALRLECSVEPTHSAPPLIERAQRSPSRRSTSRALRSCIFPRRSSGAASGSGGRPSRGSAAEPYSGDSASVSTTPAASSDERERRSSRR